MWQQRWNDRVGTSKMGEITRTVPPPWTYGHIQERHLQSTLTRLRIGHTRLTHSYLMAGERPPYCNHCQVPLTVRHLLIECPNLIPLRRRFFYKCVDQNGIYNLFMILGDLCPSPGHDVIVFLREAGFLLSI